MPDGAQTPEAWTWAQQTLQLELGLLAQQGKSRAEMLWHAFASRSGRQWPPDPRQLQGIDAQEVLVLALAQEAPHA